MVVLCSMFVGTISLNGLCNTWVLFLEEYIIHSSVLYRLSTIRVGHAWGVCRIQDQVLQNAEKCLCERRMW